MPASVAIDEGVAENDGGGSASMDVGTEGEGSAANLDLGGDDFVETTL